MSIPHSAQPAKRPISQLLNCLRLEFEMPLSPAQIPQWRGAVARSAGWDKQAFHNHIEGRKDRYAYRYPGIQYQAYRGRAALVGIGQGVAELRRWIMGEPCEVVLGKRRVPLRIAEWREWGHCLKMLESPRKYRLRQYLPMNQVNYEQYVRTEVLVERIGLLERLLVGHQLGFATAAAYQLPERLESRILRLSEARSVRIHGHRRLAFDMMFRSNLQLPEGVGLGRSVAFGFGVLE